MKIKRIKELYKGYCEAIAGNNKLSLTIAESLQSELEEKHDANFNTTAEDAHCKAMYKVLQGIDTQDVMKENRIRVIHDTCLQYCGNVSLYPPNVTITYRAKYKKYGSRTYQITINVLTMYYKCIQIHDQYICYAGGDMFYLITKTGKVKQI